MDTREVTFVLTSCGRVDLLIETIKSFDEFNTYPIKRFIITEDSCDEDVYAQVRDLFGDRMDVMCNETKKGQIKSIIDAYDTIDTEFIFHCEDDWRFFKKGFVEEAIAVLDAEPKITQVVMRSPEDLNSARHVFNFGDVEEIGGQKVRQTRPTGDFEWGNFSFNPGIKRLSDYKELGFEGCLCELDINLRWRDAGFYWVTAATPGVEHLGDDRAVPDPTRKWPKRVKPGKPKGLKRLWNHIKSGKF